MTMIYYHLKKESKVEIHLRNGTKISGVLKETGPKYLLVECEQPRTYAWVQLYAISAVIETRPDMSENLRKAREWNKMLAEGRGEQ